MAVLDFLFQGSPPANATTTTTETSATPVWYQEYLRGLLSKGNTIAAQGYTPYESARNAGFTPAQEQAFGQVSNLATTGGMPTYGAATEAIQQGVGGSSTAAAMPYAAAASAPAYSNVSSYMSPYTSSVVNEIARLGNQNFQENIMPSISNSFIGAGQYGSGRNAEVLGRAARDVQSNITGQQASALQSGYTGALGAAQTDAAREAALAGTMGGLEAGDLTRAVTGGAALGQVGQAQQEAALKNAAALQATGEQQQALNQKNLDTAYQDFINQRDWDKNQTYYLSNLIRGLKPDTTTTASTTQPYQGSTSASPLSQILGATNLASTMKRGGMVRRKGALSNRGKC